MTRGASIRACVWGEYNFRAARANLQILHPTSNILHVLSPMQRKSCGIRMAKGLAAFFDNFLGRMPVYRHRKARRRIPAKSAGCFKNPLRLRLRILAALAAKLDYRQSSIVNRQ